jgi:translin
MSEIYSHLFAIDYPKGITQDLRRKTDVARGIIEKTRGDISLSLQINRLNKNLINQQK